MTDATPPTTAPSQPLGRRLNVLIVLAVLLLAALLFRLFGLLPGRTPRWQYMVIAPPDAMLDGELNRLGAEGWEIVAARRATSSFGTASYELILKRPGVAATEQVAAVERNEPGAAAMKSDLRNLVTAQEAYFADNVTYAHNIGKLNYTQAVGDTVTIIVASGTGWSATAKYAATTKTCGIFVGRAAPPVPGQAEGSPMCL